MPWFDAGVNLLDKRFDADAVIEAAIDAGVNKLCVITTHPQEWDAAKALYQAYPENLVYTIGVHPHNAKDADDLILAQMAERFSCPGAVAVGECGLDFNRNFSPREKQIAVFEAQLLLARQINKPVYLHERDAFEQQINCLKNVYQDKPVTGIAHCFTGNRLQMQQYLQYGLFIGITGWLCDQKRGQSLRGAVEQLPLERLVMETDAPYLFPKTFKPRQRNNSPSLLPHIGSELASLMSSTVREIEQQSYINAHKLFRL